MDWQVDLEQSQVFFLILHIFIACVQYYTSKTLGLTNNTSVDLSF